MKWKLLLPILSIIAIQISQAQILRVEMNLDEADTTQVTRGMISLDASLNNGNSTAEEQVMFAAINSNGELGHKTLKHAYYLIGNIRYYQATGGPLQSTGYGHLRANFLREKQLSYELFTQFQYDVGRNLELRSLAGGGLRYRLTDALSMGLGAMYEEEHWQPITESGSLIVKQLTKLNSYLTGRVRFTEEVHLLMTIYYQTGYDQEISGFRNRLSSDLGFNIRIGKRLDYSLKSTMTYEDRPIIAVSKSVYSISNGLNYRF